MTAAATATTDAAAAKAAADAYATAAAATDTADDNTLAAAAVTASGTLVSTAATNKAAAAAATPVSNTWITAATSVDEGSAIVVTIDTTEYAAGSSLAYALTGIQAADVVGNNLSGTATIGADGKAYVTVNVAADTLTEGAQTASIAIAGKSASFVINDTSLTTQVTAFSLSTAANNADASSNTSATTFDATTADSLNTFDTVRGGSGTDTLTATMSGVAVRPNMQGVENLTLTSTGITQLNMVDVTGLTKVTSQTSTAAPVLNNMGYVIGAGLSNTSSGIEINYSASATSGPSDNMAITVSGTSGAATDIDINAAAGADNLETVTLTSSDVANRIDDLELDGAAVATLAINGAADLTITTALDTSVRTVSAGDFTGALSLTVGGAGVNVTSGTGADSITGGAGNDVIITGGGADQVTATNGGTDSINLGEGSDTIAAANLIGATDTVVGGSGSDTLSYADNADVVSTTLALTSGFDVISLADDTTNDALAVTLTDAVVGASDSDSLTIASATTVAAADTITVSANVIAANTVILQDTPSGFTLANSTVSAYQNRVTIGATSHDSDADGSLADETNVMVTLGTKADNVTGSASADRVTFVANTDGNDVDATTANESDNIALGDGNDTVSAANLISATDTVVGGAGSDTLAYADNVDVVSTGLTLTSGFDVIGLADDTTNSAIAVTLTDAVVGASDSDSMTISPAVAANVNDVVTVSANVVAANTVLLQDFNGSYTLASSGVSTFQNRVTIGAISQDNDADGSLADETNAMVTLGTKADNVTGSASADRVTFVANTDGNDGDATTANESDNIALGDGNDTVSAANLISATDTVVGGAGSDTLAYADNVDVVSTGLTLTSGFDVIGLADDTTNSAIAVTLTDAVVGASDSDSMTISPAVAANVNDVVTVSANVVAANTVLLQDFNGSYTLASTTPNRVTIGAISQDNDADGSLADETNVVVTLGTLADIVTGSSSVDNITYVQNTDGSDEFALIDSEVDFISLGDGADVVSAANLILTGDTVIGGAGADILAYASNVDVVSTGLTNVSGFDVISLADDATNNAIAVTLTDVVVGGSDSDTLTIRPAVAANVTDAVTVSANVVAANTVLLQDFNGSYTLEDSTVSGYQNRVTIGAISQDNDADGSLADETNAMVTLGNKADNVTGSASADRITMVANTDGNDTGSTVDSTESDNVNLGGGNDSVTASSLISATDTIVGGAGYRYVDLCR